VYVYPVNELDNTVVDTLFYESYIENKDTHSVYRFHVPTIENSLTVYLFSIST